MTLLRLVVDPIIYHAFFDIPPWGWPLDFLGLPSARGVSTQKKGLYTEN